MGTWNAPEWSITGSVEIIRRFPTYDVVIHATVDRETAMRRIRAAVVRNRSFWKRMTGDMSQFVGDVGESSFTITPVASLLGRHRPPTVHGSVTGDETDRSDVRVSVRSGFATHAAVAVMIGVLVIPWSDFVPIANPLLRCVVVTTVAMSVTCILHIAEGTRMARSLEQLILPRDNPAK
jgi:hypothetical protein